LTRVFVYVSAETRNNGACPITFAAPGSRRTGPASRHAAGDLASVVQAALEPANISIWTSQPDWSSRNPADSAASDVPV